MIPCWLIVTLQLAATTIIIIYEADIIVQSFSISFMARFQRTVKRGNSKPLIWTLNRKSRDGFFLALLSVLLNDELHHGGVCQCGHVPKLIRLVGGNLLQDATHDLSRTCLWEARDNLYKIN